MVIKNKVGLNGKLNFLGKDKLQNNKFEIFYKKLDILFNDSKFELTAFKDNFPIQNNKDRVSGIKKAAFGRLPIRYSKL